MSNKLRIHWNERIKARIIINRINKVSQTMFSLDVFFHQHRICINLCVIQWNVYDFIFACGPLNNIIRTSDAIHPFFSNIVYLVFVSLKVDFGWYIE